MEILNCKHSTHIVATRDPHAVGREVRHLGVPAAPITDAKHTWSQPKYDGYVYCTVCGEGCNASTVGPKEAA